MMRYCYKCKSEKDESEFYSLEKTAVRYCKECHKIYQREWNKNKAKDPNFNIKRNKQQTLRRQENIVARTAFMFHQMKRGALKRNIFVGITADDIRNKFEQQQMKCCKTGMPFDLTTGEGRKPFGPSIDRISSKGAYTIDNIQLVCNIYNFAKHNFSEGDVLLFATLLLENERIRQ